MVCGCCRFFNSTVGKKIIMALTGLILVGFVIGHMAGNLKVFFGFDSEGVARLDHYAVFLRQIGEAMLGYGNFLWVVRFVLLFSLLLHVWMAVQLISRNQESRSQKYAMETYSSATIASVSMGIGGSILLFFVFFHILHFTTGTLHNYGFVEGHVYANVYNAFQHGPVVLVYLIAMIALGLHLYHGTWSVLQTLGIESRGWNATLRCFAKGLAVIVTVGFLSVPVAFYFQKLPAPTNHFINE